MVQYHFRTTDGPSLGPIDAEEFRQRQEAGEITDDTMVWRSGLVDWTSYANLRALDQRAAQARSVEAPPLPTKAVPPPLPAAPRATQFFPCSTCEQEWPEALLEVQGNKRVCGNCRRRHAEQLKHARIQSGASGVSSGWGMWLLKTVGLAVVCGGLLFTKLYLKQKGRDASKLLQQQALAQPRAVH